MNEAAVRSPMQDMNASMDTMSLDVIIESNGFVSTYHSKRIAGLSGELASRGGKH
jgi:hypothetical protein